MIATLYANTQLTPDKNFAVDSITHYLSTIGNTNKLIYTDLLYFKNKLETTIKLELGEGLLNYYGRRYNYCCIQNTGEQPVYYYIIDMEWRSKEVVLLQLYQDTIATFGLLPMTDKTLIHRQHKDRFINVNGIYCRPLVDKTPEGINPILRKSNEKIIQHGKNKVSYEDMPWYIVYANDNAINATDYNQVNPVSTFIVPKFPITARLPNSNQGVKLFNDPQTYDGYIRPIAVSPCPNVWDIRPEKLPLYDFHVTLNMSPAVTHRCYVSIEGKYIQVYWLYFSDMQDNGLGYDCRIDYVRTTYNNNFELMYYDILNTYTWDFAYNSDVFTIDKFPQILYMYEYYGNILQPSQLNDITNWRDSNGFYESTYTNMLSSMQNAKLTDSKLIKIVELPYCPLPNYIFNGIVTFTTKYMELKVNPVDGIAFAIKVSASNNVLQGIINSQNSYTLNFDVLPPTYRYSDMSLTALKSKDFEPKLRHSEMHSFKLVYDSFVKEVKAENIDTLKFISHTENYINFTFIVSENISSAMLFDFSTTYYQEDMEDYDNILIVNRNNEKPIFSSQYINYLRTGYNFDVKARQQKEAVNAIQTGLGAVGAITGGVLGIASGNPAVAVSAIMGGVTSVTSSVVNSISQSISMTQELESKQAQLKAQAVSVSTNDDLSILDYYTFNNKLKAVEYKPSDVMENNLFNLFYYMGYKCEYMGKPNVNSRLRFNFLQASIDIDFTQISTDSKNITKVLIDDYKARFEVGVTIFHYFENTYDFEQKYENYETTLESYLQ